MTRINALSVLLPFLCLCLSPFLSACHSKPHAVKNETHGEAPPVAQTSMEAKQIAAEQDSPYVAEITFQKGSTALDGDAKQRLDRVLSKTAAEYPITQVKVISWADEEYPADKTKTLSTDQKKMAENRNQELKNYLHQKNSNWSVDTYSMAERPSAFSTFLGTTDARIKKSLETAGIPTTDSGKGKKSSKASKAIVMFIPKETGTMKK